MLKIEFNIDVCAPIFSIGYRSEFPPKSGPFRDQNLTQFGVSLLRYLLGEKYEKIYLIRRHTPLTYCKLLLKKTAL